MANQSTRGKRGSTFWISGALKPFQSNTLIICRAIGFVIAGLVVFLSWSRSFSGKSTRGVVRGGAFHTALQWMISEPRNLQYVKVWLVVAKRLRNPARVWVPRMQIHTLFLQHEALTSRRSAHRNFCNFSEATNARLRNTLASSRTTATSAGNTKLKKLVWPHHDKIELYCYSVATRRKHVAGGGKR